MERRLRLAKQLLNPDNSVLIVTIDEKEYARLSLLLEQVYPEANIQMVSTVINSAGASRTDEFSRVNEYIFFVRFGNSVPQPLPLPEEWYGNMKSAKKVGLSWNQLMRSGTEARRSDRASMFYPIFVSEDGDRITRVGDSIDLDRNRNEITPQENEKVIWPIRSNGEEGRWQIGRDNLIQIIEKGFVRLGRFTQNGMALTYLPAGEQKKIENGVFPIIGHRVDGSVIEGEKTESVKFVPGNQWNILSHNATYQGSQFLTKIIGEKRFDFPKSLYAVRDTLNFFVSDKPNALIVDFFAGSGTTLHAVNLLNAEDGGHRRCISITNNEISSDEAEHLTKAGLRQGDPEWEAKGIANYVTWPRTVCSIKGQNVKGTSLKGDYGTYHDKYFLDEEDTILSKTTGKPTRKRVYTKKEIADNSSLANMKLADGLPTNAVFYELTYENPWPIRLDRAFNAIAPILWLHAGGRGKVINKIEAPYATTKFYGVLFDYGYVSQFCDEVLSHKTIKTVFIVTDNQRRYTDVVRMLPNIEVKRLYESYLRTFEIYGEGRFD